MQVRTQQVLACHHRARHLRVAFVTQQVNKKHLPAEINPTNPRTLVQITQERQNLPNTVHKRREKIPRHDVLQHLVRFLQTLHLFADDRIPDQHETTPLPADS